jgi:hypothetical protein
MEALHRAQDDHRVFDGRYVTVQHRGPGLAVFAGEKVGDQVHKKSSDGRALSIQRITDRPA